MEGCSSSSCRAKRTIAAFATRRDVRNPSDPIGKRAALVGWLGRQDDVSGNERLGANENGNDTLHHLMPIPPAFCVGRIENYRAAGGVVPCTVLDHNLDPIGIDRDVRKLTYLLL
jgi:hypothetical protein